MTKPGTTGKIFCAFIAATVCAPACVTMLAVRTSSVQILAPDQSDLVLLPASQLVAALHAEFAARGSPLADQRQAPNGDTVYVYKGRRTAITSVSATRTIITSQTYQIGSWFAVRVATTPGGVRLSAIGKPTVNGVEVCSDADSTLSDVQYRCQDTHVREDATSDRQLITGREEAEVVRGIFVVLGERFRAPTGSP
ncbi:MAG TPA: hypothetical protein VF316_16295 [Polyangiaceae bacterium]